MRKSDKKILFVATVDEGHIIKFHIPYLRYFKENGYEVHVACAGNALIPYCDKKYELTFERTPYKLANLNAYKKLKIIIENNDYKLVHCHTPVGGVIGRLASRKARKLGTKVLYTAHGFHFYKGAPLRNWLVYYPIEKWLSRYTDCLITINEEDYNNVISKKFKAKQINLVHGVGVNLRKFEPQIIENKFQTRKEYGYEENDFILFYAAELNENKHQDLLIKVINILKDKIPSIKLLLAGTGKLENQYKELVKDLDINSNVEFLGYRSDISKLLMLSDIAVASSRREGLPVNIIEAMATGLPLVVTNVRGHRDLVNNDENGYMIKIDSIEEFSDIIQEIYKDEKLRNRLGGKGIELVQKYSLENVLEEMKHIYNKQIKSK